jgi:hypothetical protein
VTGSFWCGSFSSAAEDTFFAALPRRDEVLERPESSLEEGLPFSVGLGVTFPTPGLSTVDRREVPLEGSEDEVRVEAREGAEVEGMALTTALSFQRSTRLEKKDCLIFWDSAHFEDFEVSSPEPLTAVSIFGILRRHFLTNHLSLRFERLNLAQEIHHDTKYMTTMNLN